MRKILLSLVALAGAASFSVTADAKTFKKHVVEDHDKCFLVEYVPSTYLYNTKGKKVSGPSKSWIGDIVDGGVVIKRRNPAVYIQTRKLLEQDHYTLIPQGC